MFTRIPACPYLPTTSSSGDRVYMKLKDEQDLDKEVLFDFINLTQVHNFTVSAQDIFTFPRLSVFTVSFTGILHVRMQITKRFALSYWLVKWLKYRFHNQKVLSSSPCMFLYFFVLYFYLYSICLTSFIIDVPRPLSNALWIIIFKRLIRNACTEPVCLEHLCASK